MRFIEKDYVIALTKEEVQVIKNSLCCYHDEFVKDEELWCIHGGTLSDNEYKTLKTLREELFRM